MNVDTYDELFAKLHRASCIVGYVASAAIESEDPLTGETLKAAEDLIIAALAQLPRPVA